MLSRGWLDEREPLWQLPCMPSDFERAQKLTAVDLQQHWAELVSLRKCLFGSRDPTVFHVTDTQVIEPSVLVLRNLDTNALHRELHRGGLLFTLALPEAKAAHWVGVQHWSGDVYWLYASVQVPDKPGASYTRFSRTVLSTELADAFRGGIRALAVERRASRRSEIRSQQHGSASPMGPENAGSSHASVPVPATLSRLPFLRTDLAGGQLRPGEAQLKGEPLNEVHQRGRTSSGLKRMGEIRIGTASWTDKSLVNSGRFYPAQVKTAEARLRYYADQFSIVEVDSSYYAMPSPHSAQLWSERTPEHFQFDVKAFRLFTGHPTELAVLPVELQKALRGTAKRRLYYKDTPVEVKDELWRQFRLSLEPLQRAGKLRALLFQFPAWFVVGRDSYDHLWEIRERLPDHLLAIEFRTPSWFNERHRATTLAFQRENRMCNVIVDEPRDVPGISIPTVWEVTNPQLAMLRLHGRNRATWNKPGLSAASERFNYDYSEDELREFIPPVLRLAELADEVHVICNINYEDQGVRAARTLQGLFRVGRQNNAAW
jgi:uncharacterized protein YecE (DUF72 family)